MSDPDPTATPTGGPPPVGSIGWLDLTVPDAEPVRRFYAEVVGWTSSPVDMGGYEDWCVQEPGSGRTVAGICHARGANEGLPPVWLPYLVVGDVEAAARRAEEHGGRVVRPVRDLGPHGRFCVVRDPAGAYAALHQPAG